MKKMLLIGLTIISASLGASASSLLSTEKTEALVYSLARFYHQGPNEPVSISLGPVKVLSSQTLATGETQEHVAFDVSVTPVDDDTFEQVGPTEDYKNCTAKVVFSTSDSVNFSALLEKHSCAN